MAREWKPGDVALVKFAWQVSHDPLVCIRAEQTGALGWLHPGKLGGFTSDRAPAGPVSIRPLVVIDAEDREQVERLLASYHAQYPMGRGDLWGTHADNLQAALREFANPPPPKPEEPTGLGAVVEDADGVRWLRHSGSIAPWHRHDGQPNDRSWRYFNDIDAVRVLSEGVPS